jgi:hypothetical protein
LKLLPYRIQGIRTTYSLYLKWFVGKWGRDKPFSTNRRENCVLSIPVIGEIVHNNNNDVFSFDYRLDWRLIYKKVKKMV